MMKVGLRVLGARVRLKGASPAGRVGTVVALESLNADPLVRVRFDEQREGEGRELVGPLSLFEVRPPLNLRKEVGG